MCSWKFCNCLHSFCISVLSYMCGNVSELVVVLRWQLLLDPLFRMAEVFYGPLFEVSRLRTEPQWPNGLQHCVLACMVMGLNPTNTCGYIICKYMDWKGLAAMLTSIQLAGVAKVNLRIIQVRTHARDPPWLWNAQYASKSPKQEHQWPHKKDLCPPKLNLKSFWTQGTCPSQFSSFELLGAIIC